ncbi:unnamed protein product [Porites evermanni]|uniref:Syndecan/Neurexin domain-containing protein n=1 Tax=Porites evermanni TaxID=104178 RepID=A0ABN8SJF6_9CNID|nr:unnamed protein product [Porites evermanni]
MTFFMKPFKSVVCILVIYGCFDCKIAPIGASDPALVENVDKGSEQERKAFILNEDDVFDVSSYHKQVERRENKYDKGETESYTIDDEDGERVKRAVGGGGKQHLNSSSLGTVFVSTITSDISTRSLDKIVSLNSTAIASSTPLMDITTFNVIVSTSVLHDVSASKSDFSTPSLSTIHGSSDTKTKSHTNVFTSMETSFGASVLVTRVTRASSVVVSTSSSFSFIEPTSRSTKTTETTTKEGNDVANREDPSPRKKTLFGFVTIEILVALLAGAACAVILVVFLVYRLKKRGEGSYELQETLMLKSGGYSDEKEVFV